MTEYLLLSILGMGAMTFGLRALPFLMPGRWYESPVMEWVRARLPAAIMMVLAVYCLQGAGWGSWPHGLPEAIAAVSVAGLHLAFRNMMASIGLGTALYMLLRQVF